MKYEKNLIQLVVSKDRDSISITLPGAFLLWQKKMKVIHNPS
jgi:hypothetical protein